MTYKYRKIKTGSTIVVNKLQVYIFSPEIGDFAWFDVPGCSFYDENIFDKKMEVFLSYESNHPYKYILKECGELAGFDKDIKIPFSIVGQPHTTGGIFMIKKFNEALSQFVYTKEFGDWDDACFKASIDNFLLCDKKQEW